MAKGKTPEPESPVIYVDTSVFIDLISNEQTPHPTTGEPRRNGAKALLDAVNDGRVVLGTSALVDAEIGAHALVRDGGPDIHKMVRGWLDHPDTRYLEIDRFLAADANRLTPVWNAYAAKGKKLGGADALHLAAAVRLGCGYLMAQDGGFPLGETVDGVRVMLPEQVWPATLLDGLSTA